MLSAFAARVTDPLRTTASKQHKSRVDGSVLRIGVLAVHSDLECLLLQKSIYKLNSGWQFPRHDYDRWHMMRSDEYWRT
jgi:hypothetical protein